MQSNLPNIFNYIEDAVEYRRFIIMVTFVGAMISLLIVLLLPNVYKAKARILPPQQDQNFLDMFLDQKVGGMLAQSTSILQDASPSNIYMGIIDSEILKDAIIDKYNLMDVYDVKYRLEAYNTFDDMLNVKCDKKDGIIDIMYYDKDPKRAAKIVNSIIEELENIVVNMNNASANSYNKFLVERLSDAKTEMQSADNRLREYKNQNNIIEIDEQAKGVIKYVSDIMAQLVVEETKLSALQRIYTDSSQEIKNQKSVVSKIKSQILKIESNAEGKALPSISTVADKQSEYLKLVREVKIKEAIVDGLERKIEMTDIVSNNKVAGVQVIQNAKVPDYKTKPKRAAIVIASTILSFVIALVTVFLYDNYKKLDDESASRLHGVFYKIKSLKRLLDIK